MKQIPVEFEDEMAARLTRRAALEGKSVVQVVQEAVESHLASSESAPDEVVIASANGIIERDKEILERLKAM